MSKLQNEPTRQFCHCKLLQQRYAQYAQTYSKMNVDCFFIEIQQKTQQAKNLIEPKRESTGKYFHDCVRFLATQHHLKRYISS